MLYKVPTHKLHQGLRSLKSNVLITLSARGIYGEYVVPR